MVVVVVGFEICKLDRYQIVRFNVTKSKSRDINMLKLCTKYVTIQLLSMQCTRNEKEDNGGYSQSPSLPPSYPVGPPIPLPPLHGLFVTLH